MKRLWDPRGKMLIAMATFGTLALFVRNISLPSGELALCRAVMASLLLGGFLLITGQRIPFAAIKKELPLLLISGVAMGFNWILLFEAYKYTTVSVATLSYYFAPVLVTIACPILFREKMGIKQWVCFIMSTVGIVLITGLGDLSGGSSHLTGILFGLGAACLYATVVLLNKFIKGVEGIHRTFLQFAAAAAVLLIVGAVFGIGAISGKEETITLNVYNWGQYISNGEDDSLDVIAAFEEKYPHIKRIYVRAEYPDISKHYRDYLLEKYEDTYYPESIVGSGRAVYVKRNYEMIDNSRFCIVYFDGTYVPNRRKSGTETALNYAKKKKKELFVFNG